MVPSEVVKEVLVTVGFLQDPAEAKAATHSTANDRMNLWAIVRWELRFS